MKTKLTNGYQIYYFDVKKYTNYDLNVIFFP